MKFSVEKSDLVEMAALAVKIAPKAFHTPIRQNDKLTAENDTVTFEATNLGLWFRYRIPADVGIAGCKTIPVHDLVKILKQAHPGRVTIEAENDEQIIVKTGGDSYALETQNADDFPFPPEFEPIVEFTLPSLDEIIYAVPKNDIRKMLNGIFFDADGQTLNLVGTNGKQAAWGKKDLISTPFQAILPRTLLTNLEESATVKIGESFASLEIGAAVYTAKLLEENYVPYRLVWPTEVNYSFSVPLVDLKSLLKRACLMADKRSNCVILTVGEGRLEATSKRYDKGTFRGSIPVESNSPEFKVAFNAVLLLDTLGNLNGKTIKMGLQRADWPVLFSIPGSTTSHLVMPLKVKEYGEPEE